MKDIVERLRESHQNVVMASGGRATRSIYSDAADEIERLRSKHDEAKS